MKVENLTSPRSGRQVPNQFVIITTETNYVAGMAVDRDVEYFQSYESIIVKKVQKAGAWRIFLDERCWNCSRTTSKYRNQFLCETTRETREKIASGEYTLTNLNLGKI